MGQLWMEISVLGGADFSGIQHLEPPAAHEPHPGYEQATELNR